jgi:predicted ATPase
MEIKHINIKYFRSIKNIDIVPAGINIFVGQNNHGKTNIFEAIEWFYNGSGNVDELTFQHDKNNTIEVEIEFNGAQEGIEKMLNEKKKEVLKKFLGSEDTIKIRRMSIDSKKREIFNENKDTWVANPAGFDNALNDLLPTLEYVKTENTLKDVSSYKKGTPIAQMLSGVLSAILSEDPQYQKFQKDFEELFSDDNSAVRRQLDNLSDKVEGFLQKQFPDCSKVEFTIGQPSFDDLLKNFDTEIDDGVRTKADEKGDGMQRALMLAILQTYCEFRKENKERSKNFVFLIDEGELHLHPSAQRKLKEALKDISQNGDQVLLNTHSPVLIADRDESQKLFKVEKVNKITNVSEILDSDKKYVVYDMLGGKPADLLLPSNFIIVEGRSDYEFMKIMMDRFYPEYKNMHILYSEGDIERQKATLRAVGDTYNTLYCNPVYKDRAVLLCDKPSEGRKTENYNSFVKSFSLQEDNNIFTLSETDIEMIYPAPYKKRKEELTDDFDKVKYAIEVANAITKEDFESSMLKVHNALKMAYAKSYK